MTLSALCTGDSFVRDAIARAERERDLADMCADASRADGDALAEQEFTAEAADWQSWIDQLEAAI